MIVKKSLLLHAVFLLCLPSVVSANLTTLQSWDPIPFYNAANLNMPPDTPFCYLLKKRLCDEDADTKKRHWGLNFSPFVQRAIRAQQTDNIYFGQDGTNPIAPGDQMGDYQGTLYAMGLFIGQNPEGNSIWGGPTATDNALTTSITQETVTNAFTSSGSNNLYNFNYPNIINAVCNLNDTAGQTTSSGQVISGPYALIYSSPTNPPTDSAPSIFSETVLEQDLTYFGAFSVPLTYQKAGFRWEINLDISDSFGFLVRGGFVQVSQLVGNPIPLSTSSTPNPNIYNNLNTVGNGLSGNSTTPLAQSIFNEWVTNNLDYLLDADNGVNYDLTSFNQAGIEDIQILGFMRHTFPVHPADPNKYASMLVTPYAMFGWTIPISPVKDYSKLYGLPFGNNSHTSIGGTLGITFDFIDSIEFGFEFGATTFLEKIIYQMPCPTHQLQRVIYPFRADVNYQPGFNGQFAAVFNAYEFIQNTSFSFRYNYVIHNQDTFTPIVANPYFLPEYLENLTGWTSQMFIAALTFEIQPSMYISVAWQGSFAQKNAYCSNTILGSLNFLF